MATSVAVSSFPLTGNAFAFWNLRMASARVMPAVASVVLLRLGLRAEDTADQPYLDKNLYRKEVMPKSVGCLAVGSSLAPKPSLPKNYVQQRERGEEKEGKRGERDRGR